MHDHIAHVKQDDTEKWHQHTLTEHSLGTAQIAKENASAFGSGEWGQIVGLWHDLGKARPAFQKHIKKSSGYDPNASISSEHDPNKNHASTGAIYAVEHFQKEGEAVLGRVLAGALGRALAYMIAGHHAGLPDYTDEAKGRSLDDLLLRDTHFVKEALSSGVSSEILKVQIPKTKIPMSSMDDLHMWIRMVFSALVDADFRDTEAFMNPEKTAIRQAVFSNMENIRSHFHQHMQRFAQSTEPSKVNTIRAEILQQVQAKAQQAPGVYTMTVPTGGGKTLSSMAFALDHAIQFAKRRIIYAIPYTSIIEQTASIFRDIFAPLGEVVLEHHSNVEVIEKKETTTSRLATENWDMPIVVTTTVQLFESLFAAKPSRCRKLHNIANSVVVLDETQLLPVAQLKPIRHAIGLLSKHYGVTFLLTTATPTPSQGFADAFGKELLQDIATTEVIEKPGCYYEQLRRVKYHLPVDFFAPQTWEDIASELQKYGSVLAVVNRRDDARQLYQHMPEHEGLFHLSALMCPKHREEVIATIKKRLKQGKPTQVVSTQLVEAGVDFDFPVVYRAMAGLDSIIQAGGRCNREGELENADGEHVCGQVFVFVPPSKPPRGLEKAFQVSTSLLSGYTGELDSPELMQDYFVKLHAQLREFDVGKVLNLLQSDAKDINIQFRTAAQCFQMIDDQSFTIFVDYGQNEEERKKVKHWINMLDDEQQHSRWLIRQLQPYSISMSLCSQSSLVNAGHIKETESGYYVIAGAAVYHNKLGFVLPQDVEQSSPQDSIF